MKTRKNAFSSVMQVTLAVTLHVMSESRHCHIIPAQLLHTYQAGISSCRASSVDVIALVPQSQQLLSISLSLS